MRVAESPNDAVTEALTSIQSVINSLKSFIINNVSYYQQQLSSLSSSISNYIQESKQDVASTTKAVVTSLANYLKQHDEEISKLMTQISQHEATILANSLTQMMNVSDYVRQLIQQDLQAHEDWLSGIKSLLEGHLKGISEWFKGFGDWFTNVLLATLTRVWGQVLNYLGKLDEYIAKGFVSGLKEIDKVIMDNLEDTYVRMALAMYKAQKEVARRVLQEVST